MAYQTVTNQGLFSRLGGSIKGIISGIVLIPVGIGVLFWNEGNFIKTKKGLEEGAANVINIEATTVSADNNGKLVHLSGPTATNETLSDNQLSVRVTDSVRLNRKAEMFQWKENTRQEKKEKLGGGEETVTTYTYSKEWAPNVIDSSQFKDPEYIGLNPATMLFSSDSWSAGNVTLGAFRLNSNQIGRITGDVPVQVGEEQISALPENLQERAKISSQFIYFGVSPESPAIGDVRVSFTRVPVAEVSLVAKQNGNTFEPYATSQGTNINLFTMGAASAETMFQDAQDANVFMTWIFRALGFVAILMGFNMIFAPLGVLASVLPFVAGIVRFGTGILAFVLAAPIALITIAIGWLTFRPVIGITILVFAVILPIAAMFFRKKKPATETVTPAPPAAAAT